MKRSKNLRALGLSLAVALGACGRGPAPSTPQPSAEPGVAAPSTPTLPPTATHTPAPTRTPAATPSPTVTPTPDPYAAYYVDSLRERTYGGGAIEVVETLQVTGAFTRTLIAYPSDGLTVYGFMNIPRGEGPFPVVIVNHGYINPASYQTLTYMTRYTDPLAAAGFLVIHPDYRGYGASEAGANPFRIGYAVDVLNLVSLVELLPEADPEAIGLFGHSMGGGISLRTITVSREVKAALLYGSMSGDEQANYDRIQEWVGSGVTLPELAVPAEALARISPINSLEGVGAAVSLHHGAADSVVPPEWSDDLYQRLLALGKEVEYYSYPGQPHTFVGEGHTLLIERAIAFFREHLTR